jgi:ribonuclease HII
MRDDYTMWDIEGEMRRKGYRTLVGVDEVGRGPLVGPVVACAVSLKVQESPWNKEEQALWSFIKDSKKLSEKRREEAEKFIRERFFVGIGRVEAETIDRVNILHASFLAMKQAISQWKREVRNQEGGKTIFLVDGNQKIENMSIEQRSVTKGDARVKCIAGASIVAKVFRDKEMVRLAQEYPFYGFERHKGYGTKDHMEALRQFGPTPEHRKSFAPVKRCLRELREYGYEG